MPSIKFLLSNYCNWLVTTILLLSKVILSCFCCAKKKLVYIIIAALSSYQPTSYTKYIKLNIRLSYNVQSISNAKYTRLIILYNLLVAYLICFKVLDLG